MFKKWVAKILSSLLDSVDKEILEKKAEKEIERFSEKVDAEINRFSERVEKEINRIGK